MGDAKFPFGYNAGGRLTSDHSGESQSLSAFLIKAYGETKTLTVENGLKSDIHSDKTRVLNARELSYLIRATGISIN